MGVREPGTGRVEDLWTKKNPAESGPDRIPTAGHGKGKRWLVRFVDANGEEVTRRFDRKVPAREWLKTITAQVRSGAYSGRDGARRTVGELYAEWEPSTVHLKPKTRYIRQSTWNKHVSPYWGKKAAGRIRKTDVTKWVADLHTAKTGVATIRHALAVLRLVLGHGVDAGVLASNPALGVKLPREMKGRRSYLTVPQVEDLSRAVKRVAGKPLTGADGQAVQDDHGRPVYLGGEQYGALVRTLAYTGLRWGEVTGLHVEDVDFERRRLHVQRAMSTDGGKIIEGTPKTHEQRSVPFPASIADELATLVEGRHPDSLVFATSRGTPLSNSNFRARIWAPAVKALRASDDDGQESEFPDLTVHDLRHTAASLAISAGANVKAVQAMLGHASAVMTLDTYADLFDDDLDAVGLAVDAAIIDGKRQGLRAV